MEGRKRPRLTHLGVYGRIPFSPGLRKGVVEGEVPGIWATTEKPLVRDG